MTSLAPELRTLEIASTDADAPTFDLVSVRLTAAERYVIALQPINADVGLGAVISALAAELAQNPTAHYPEDERRHLSRIIRGLVSAVAAERVDDESFAVSPKHRIVVRAMQVIYARLDDPRLTSQSIARAIGVSVRTLQAAFSDSSITVAGTVRELRQEFAS